MRDENYIYISLLFCLCLISKYTNIATIRTQNGTNIPHVSIFSVGIIFWIKSKYPVSAYIMLTTRFNPAIVAITRKSVFVVFILYRVLFFYLGLEPSGSSS